MNDQTPVENELLLRLLYKPTWRFFESIHTCIVGCVTGALGWLVEKLQPFGWFVALFDLVGVLLLLVILLRGCFQ